MEPDFEIGSRPKSAEVCIYFFSCKKKTLIV